MNRIDRGRTARFCEPWAVQEVHTGPLFQALNSIILDSLPCFFFPIPRHYFGLWNWIILSNKKPLPHSFNKETLGNSFNQETLGKYRSKFKIRPAWSLDCKTKISTKKKKKKRRRKKWNKQMYLTKKKKKKKKKKPWWETWVRSGEKSDTMKHW